MITEEIAGVGRTAPSWINGSRRVVSPEETVARLRGILALTGITRVADVTGLDRIGIPVAIAVRPNSRGLATSQGKGHTLAAAQASALMESLESWHAERVRLPLRLATYDELRWQSVVADPSRLPRARSGSWNPASRILWTIACRLSDGQPVWVPYELVHTDFTLPAPSGHGAFLASSNGLASGNVPIEALCHALAELIERDATTLWQMRSQDDQAASRLDLNTVNDEPCRQLIAKFLEADTGLAVWDVTGDTGVATFMCMVCEPAFGLRTLHSALGAGCHPDRAIALSRALTEAAQSRLTVIAGSREDILRTDYEQARDPDVLQRDRRLVFEGTGSRCFTDVPTSVTDSLEEDLALMTDRLAGIDCPDVLVVDLTQPELGISVVRVIVPGLESMSIVDHYSPGARAEAVMA